MKHGAIWLLSLSSKMLSSDEEGVVAMMCVALVRRKKSKKWGSPVFYEKRRNPQCSPGAPATKFASGKISTILPNEKGNFLQASYWWNNIPFIDNNAYSLHVN